MGAVSKEFYESLPKKRMGCGCLILNEAQEILLLKPTYKDSWEIPGGIVEEDESPRQCCKREVLEELSLKIELTHLLLVDYNPGDENKTESLMFVFGVVPFSASKIQSIFLNENEHSEYAFFKVSQLPEEMTESLRRRVSRALELYKTGGTAYFEN